MRHTSVAVTRKDLSRQRNLPTVPGAFEESPPLHAPTLINIGVCGYCPAAVSGVNVRTVVPSICHDIEFAVQSIEYFLKPPWLFGFGWKAPRLYVVVWPFPK